MFSTTFKGQKHEVRRRSAKRYIEVRRPTQNYQAAYEVKRIPEKINAAWIGTLADVDLLCVESRLHEKFAVMDRKHKTLRGSKYVLLQGPTELIEAWDRWSRVDRAARARSLAPKRRVEGGGISAVAREATAAKDTAARLLTVRSTAKDPGEH